MKLVLQYEIVTTHNSQVERNLHFEVGEQHSSHIYPHIEAFADLTCKQQIYDTSD